MSDGSVLRLEKVAYGNRENIQIGTLLDRLKQQLPQAWVQRFTKPNSGNRSSWWNNTTTHTNNDALYIYISRRKGALGDFQDVGSVTAQLVDEDGCVFTETQSGGEDNGVLPPTPPGTMRGGMCSSLNWYRFEAFPRRQRKFKLRLYDQQGQMMSEFTIRNPAPPPPPSTNWVVEPLPIARTNGDTTFTLTQLTIKSNANRFGAGRGWNPKSIKPKYEIIEGGQPSTNWQALDMELYDSTGNFASEMSPTERYLCPREPAWKLRVKFFASEEAKSASNATWTLRGIAVPDAGKFTWLTNAQDLFGVPIKAVTLAGPGDYVYRDEVPVQAGPLKDPLQKSSLQESWNNNGRNSTMPTYTAHGLMHHLYVSIGAIDDDQRLTIRAIDNQGRIFYAHEWFAWRPTEPAKSKPGRIYYLEKRYSQQDAPFFVLDLPPDCKTVDLDFCVHNCFAPEFIFKPPEPGMGK